MNKMRIFTNIARILVGALFVFSGFIKANDPLGFSYKLQEYFEVFNMNWMIPLSLFLAIFICIVEISVGFALLIGAYRKLTLWLLSLMMIFFTFLTFYSAYYNKVTSCGCFGDAIPLTPWQSFYKDIFLSILTLVLIGGRSNIHALFGKMLEQVTMGLFIVAAIAFPVYTYTHLPVIDFRPYKIGTNLYSASPEHIKVKFFYKMKNKKTGKTEEFDHFPSDWAEWEQVSSRTEPLNKKVKAIEHFEMQNKNGDDHRDELLTLPGYSFILVEYDLDKSDKSVQGTVNDFAQLCKKNNVSFVALTTSSIEKINAFKKDADAGYDFYISPDDVPLKAMIRSNPGLVMLKDCVVTAKWPFRDFPSYSDVKLKYLKK
jgi:uncharacterized membrane protein YphA (DoxX/SURF4 family)